MDYAFGSTMRYGAAEASFSSRQITAGAQTSFFINDAHRIAFTSFRAHLQMQKIHSHSNRTPAISEAFAC